MHCTLCDVVGTTIVCSNMHLSATRKRRKLLQTAEEISSQMEG